MLRHAEGRNPENVCLIASAPPEALNARKWLELNRLGFGGIENGLHQRLDASHNDDRCRIRHGYAMFVAGLFRRIANSLFMEWRSRQPHPEYLTTTDFQAAMGEDHCRPAERRPPMSRPAKKSIDGRFGWTETVMNWRWAPVNPARFRLLSSGNWPIKDAARAETSHDDNTVAWRWGLLS